MSRACVRLTQVGYLWFRAFLVVVLVETYVAQGLYRRPLKPCCPEHPPAVAVLSIFQHSLGASNLESYSLPLGISYEAIAKELQAFHL